MFNDLVHVCLAPKLLEADYFLLTTVSFSRSVCYTVLYNALKLSQLQCQCIVTMNVWVFGWTRMSDGNDWQDVRVDLARSLLMRSKGLNNYYSSRDDGSTRNDCPHITS